MVALRYCHFTLLAGTAFSLPGHAMAQPAPPAPAAAKRVFVAADFARFAPKTAYDLIVQLPGFTLHGADQERGLGQASENVLINGQRVANKSGGAIAELRNVAVANVERIEIVEAASLGIAGLSGEVANVIVKQTKKASGQFEWRPEFRAHYAKPNLLRGSASYSGKRGPVDYTFSVKNQANRGAYGGPVLIFSPDGTLIETREEIVHSESDLLTFQGKFGIDGPGSSVGNLTLAYTPYRAPYFFGDSRERLDGDHRARTTSSTLNGYYIDLSGDYEFAVGPGRLKLIGLRHYDHEPVTTTQVTRFDSGAADEGVRFTRDSHIGETVARAEYGFKTGKSDWQVTVERAFNSLDQRGALAELTPGGDFVEVDFPGGSGKVVETRYEAIGTFSRPLTPRLDFQLAAGGEISTLERVDGDVEPRKFFRPKGSLTLGWRPRKGWDASLKLRRRVGQISFYDFLTQPNLSNDRESAGNPDLVPPQSWEVEGEVGRELGRWGKTRLKVYGHRIDDIIEIIPIGEHGEAVGNLPRATRFGAESTSTFLLDPLGWRGAKLDLGATIERTRVRDPLTGEQRPISGSRDRSLSLSLRHDIPGSKIAWGIDAEHGHYGKNYFLSQISRGWEGPVFANIYVEHKDVFGLTVRAVVGNILNARHRYERTVYDGRRERDPVAFVQRNNQLIGPIFALSVKGSF